MTPPESALPPNDLELQVLLHSTGELPASDAEALEAQLAAHPELAAFAKFIADDLPTAARAPRDFAAAAIFQAPRDFAAEAIAAAAAERPAGKVLRLRRPWLYAAAGAAAAVVALLVYREAADKPGTPLVLSDPPLAQPAPARLTAQITTRLAAVEAELTEARSRISRGRYHSTSL